MISTIKVMVYKAFGLCISSEILLPELPKLFGNENGIDVEIKIADLNKLWDELVIPEQKYLIKKDLIIFKVSDTAIFYIKEGKRIIVSPLLGADVKKIRLYILGTCMGALLLQRNILPLHGSAVAINGKAYAFIGDRGAGKSTLAAAFLEKGYPLLTDDIIAISFTKDNIPIITPSYPNQKLWQESLNWFGLESDNYSPIFGRETKYSVPVLSKFTNDSLPITSVFELVKTKELVTQINPLESLIRLQTLFYHTFRSFLISRLTLMEWHFASSVKIINHINMFRLNRPNRGYSINDMVSLIIKTIKEGE
jgi:hypothetical protein